MPDMNDQTPVVGAVQESEPMIAVDEYAARVGLSRRTIDRYIRQRRLETVKHLGRTYIVDKPPKSPSVQTGQTPDKAGQVKTSEPGWIVKSDLVRFGYLQAQAKAKTGWQVYAIVASVLTIGAAGVAGWLFLDRQSSIERRTGLESELSKAAAERASLQTELDRTREALNTANERGLITAGQLQDRISELVGRIVELSRRIATADTHEPAERTPEPNEPAG